MGRGRFTPQQGEAGQAQPIGTLTHNRHGVEMAAEVEVIVPGLRGMAQP